MKITELEFAELAAIAGIKKDLAAKQARWAKAEQKLSIGIMGQVKAGKSTFLNALLFNGKPILPEAATPKTANLTKISYGEKFCLTVHFYDAAEWDSINTLAATGSESMEAKVAAELVAMVNTLNAADIRACLEQGSKEIVADNLEGLLGLLNQYTGNNGTHTALVKSTEITLPLDELKGFEVVDTPGMNDPVASRTQKTREYMANCDVVFFLSRCSQFLDKADDDLLRHQLPSKGVKRLVVIAGQFDSAIIDDGYEKSSLDETIANLEKRLTRHAKNKAEEIAQSKIDLNDTQHQMVVDSLSCPVFASTFAHGFANWDKSSWSASMQHSFSELSELADEEWDGYEFTQQDWQRIGNFSVLERAYLDAKADRQKLLDEQKRSLLPEAYQSMFVEYKKLAESLAKRIELLSNKEVADIEKEQRLYQQKASSIASSLALSLSQARNEAKQQANELIAQLQLDQHEFSKLSTRKGSREEEYSYTVSTSKWYNPFSWGSSRTVYSTRTVSYDYLNPHDAIEQVNAFGGESAKQIVAVFGKLIAPAQLKHRLKTALVNELDTNSEEFDPNLFKTMLENFVSKLDLPRFDIELGDTTKLISANFSGEITSADQMQKLKSSLAESLAMVLARLQAEFDKQFTSLMQGLEKAGNELNADLTKDIEASLAKIKQQIANKQDEIASLENDLAEIEAEQKELQTKLAVL